MQNHLRLFALSLLFVSLSLFLPSCGADDDPGRPSPEVSSWTTDGRSVGDVHNEILGEYRSLPEEGSALSRARRAIQRRAQSEAVAAPGLPGQVRRFVDGPSFDVIERRLAQARQLVREEHPDPEALTRMLLQWGIESSQARELGSTIAHILLSGRLPETPAKAARSEAERVFYDVLQSSREFWTKEDALAKVTVESEVIAFDALGALGGLGFGVIGSIVASAVYSIAWQEAGAPEDETTGGCAGCH